MAQQLGQGPVSKMRAHHSTPVSYELPLGDASIAINPLIGKSLRLQFEGAIRCTHCGRNTKKSFNQGYCYPCFQRLAQCDACIMSPEKCHYEAGTCREPEWGERNCMIDHYVYLANSSGLKVGITRGTQIPTRWLDQGATQAIPLLRVGTRHLSGLVEVALKQHVTDRTNWRAMLKGTAETLDMRSEAERLLELIHGDITQLQDQYGIQAVEILLDPEIVDIEYPVLEYPSKVSSFNLDKVPVAEGRLMGVKGQYLIFDSGVINLRKYTSYELSVSLLD